MFLLGKTVKCSQNISLLFLAAACESIIISIRISIYKNHIIYSEKIELQHHDSVCSLRYGCLWEESMPLTWLQPKGLWDVCAHLILRPIGSPPAPYGLIQGLQQATLALAVGPVHLLHSFLPCLENYLPWVQKRPDLMLPLEHTFGRFTVNIS